MDRRGVRWVGVGVASATALLVLGDRTAHYAVERVVAGRIQDCLGTPDRPAVGIAGFPFLPHLVRREFDTVTMSARDVNAGGVRVGELRADLHGVRQQGDGAKVDSLAGTGLVTYDDLSAMAPGVRISYGGEGRIRVDAGFSVLSVSATARPRIVGDAVVLEPEQLTSGLTGVLDVGALPSISYRLRDLPAGVRVDMDPTERGVEFAFDGTDVAVAQTACSAS